MKIYFAASTGQFNAYRPSFEKILSILKEQGNTILDSWIVLKLENRQDDFTPQEVLIREKEQLLDSDIMVAEVSTPSIGVGYLIGQALFNKKPILCLYNVSPKGVSDVISGSTSGLLTSKHYDEKNLSKILREYLASIKLPSLTKFNFLVTPDVEKYLEWGSKKEKKSKAQFLRDKIIRELINKDEDYKSY